MPSPESPPEAVYDVGRDAVPGAAAPSARQRSRRGAAQPVPVEVAALGLIEVITAMCSVIATLEAKLATVFDQHTQATVTSFPRVGPVHGGHVLGKIGDDPHRLPTLPPCTVHPPLLTHMSPM